MLFKPGAKRRFVFSRTLPRKHVCRDGRDAKEICQRAVKQLLAGKAADTVKQWAKAQ